MYNEADAHEACAHGMPWQLIERAQIFDCSLTVVRQFSLLCGFLTCIL